VKKKQKKLVFYGTPDFARDCLKYLIKEGFDISAVVTAPDKSSGRGRKIIFSSVKEFCLNKNIKIFQPNNLKDSFFLSKIQNIAPDFQIVVAFRMLPKEVWSISKVFTFNLHASLLPNYRGAAPINWAIINGEKKTGITTFIIDDKIDTGSILLKEEVKIAPLDTFFTLSNKLLNKAGPLIKKTIEFYFSEKLYPKKQFLKGNEKFAPKLTSKNIKIDWNESIDLIEKKIRGLSPFPGAWTFFNNNNNKSRMKIIKSSIIYINHKNNLNKILVKDGDLFISLKEGYLKCDEIQLENKKKMSTKSLLNGYKFSENSFVL
tara:strand:+ start:312 stop:1265 length:954 start_codon:yes stop_codon:yes gene_type:complete